MSWILADAEEAKQSGGMVALYPRPDFAQMLAVPGGEPEEDLHVTLVFLGDDVGYQSPDGIARAVAQLSDSGGEISARIFGHAVFNPDGDDPCGVYLVGHSPELAQLHDAVVQAVTDVFPLPDQHEPWIPHITAGYAGDAGEPQVGEYTGEVIFDRLGLAFAGQTQFYPLASTVMASYYLPRPYL